MSCLSQVVLLQQLKGIWGEPALLPMFSLLLMKVLGFIPCWHFWGFVQLLEMSLPQAAWGVTGVQTLGTSRAWSDPAGPQTLWLGLTRGGGS